MIGIYLLAGAYAGFVSGLLGVGGAVVVVPALTLAFTLQGFAPAEIARLAIATSLASIAFTSLASMRAHAAAGAVDWAIVRRMAPAVMIGTFAGAQAAARLPSLVLQGLFVVLVIAMASSLVLDVRPAPHRDLPGPAGLSAVGALIGALSSLVGIGGGVMSVPFLTYCNLPVHRAIGTSAALGVPLALAGTAGFVVAGLGVQGLPPASIGYVHLPALAGIVVVSVLVAPLGAWIAHRHRAVVLKRVFALFIVAVGLKMASGLA
jgi:uncharacterized membrane protein YfcA